MPVLGGYVSIADPKIVENLALPGKLKFLWIEALQNDLGPREVQQLILACENEEVIPIVRVPRNDPEEIKKYLGTGVMGIVIPRIRNRKDAEAAIAAVKYPPEGRRPPGVERANRYMGRLKETLESANRNLLVVFTLDNQEMLENIDSILSVRGFDVLHIGPLAPFIQHGSHYGFACPERGHRESRGPGEKTRRGARRSPAGLQEIGRFPAPGIPLSDRARGL